MAKQIPLGTRGEAETTVQFMNTLTAWKEHLPPVYATPHMIGIMEAAGYNALEPDGRQLEFPTVDKQNPRSNDS
jgi:predicted thioesterase